MLFRKKTVICREGWYYLLVMGFVVTGSILREVNLLMVMAGMMFFPFLFNLRAVYAGLRGLDVRRRFRSTVSAGDLLVVELLLSKRSGKHRLASSSSWAVTVQDSVRNETFDRAGRKLSKLKCWHLGPGEESRLVYQFRPNRRGRYTFGPLMLSTRFPLGLVSRTIAVDREDTLTVLPRFGRLTENWGRLYQAVRLGSYPSRSRHGMFEGDFHSLRDWRPGDSHRRIHWRTTARRGAPVVRQFELHHEQDLALLVDLWQPSDRPAADADVIERMVSFAATVVSDICRRGSSYIFLGTTGRELAIDGGPASSGVMYELLQRLAIASADKEDRLAELLVRTLESIPPGPTIVIVSPRHVDVGQLEQDAGLWEKDRLRAATGRIVTVDASTSELADYFVEQELPAAAAGPATRGNDAGKRQSHRTSTPGSKS